MTRDITTSFQDNDAVTQALRTKCNEDIAKIVSRLRKNDYTAQEILTYMTNIIKFDLNI